MINVEYNHWNKWYEKIISDFGFNKYSDEESALLLNKIIDKKGKFNIANVDLPHQCIIFGAGPSIKSHIQLIKHEFNLDDYVIIAADGATTALLEENILPRIIVTDLDGKIDSIKKANNSGSILYVHAHGDNIEKIKKYVPQLENIIPTTQSQPIGLLENYGGFTDGDRAVHIAVYALNMRKIILAGMDFGTMITKYSRPEIDSEFKKADDSKKLKLEYAEKLIKSLETENPSLEFIDLRNF